MKLCVISSKECWQDETGHWVSSGGFPLQMSALGSLFDELTLVILQGKRRANGTPLPAGACVIPLKKPSTTGMMRKLSVATQLPYYLRILRREIAQADAVHTPVPGDIGLLGLWVALSMRKRVILRYGSSWPRTTETTLMNDVTKAFARRFAGGKNVMLATGAGEQPPAPNMHWIFTTAISDHEVKAIEPVVERGLSDPARLAYVGRLSPEKGLIYLIEALARMKKEGFTPLPSVELIGDGPQRPELEELARQRGVGDDFIFVGQLNRATLMQYLQTVDLCVLPSLTESFCKARLDAMLCGLPVITTAVGFGREITGADGERGWIVEAGDAQALADTLKTVLTAPQDWPAVRRRCRAFVEHYTLESWAQEIGQICAQQWKVSFKGGKLTV